MRRDGAIDYVELTTSDLDQVKRFYNSIFGWRFVDYGPQYAAFEDAGLDGGFAVSAEPRRDGAGSALVVLYASDLEAMAQRVLEGGGVVTQPIFSFPGGRRFHFRDPAGNELAIWSDA